MKSPHAQLPWLALAVATLASTTLAHGPHESLFLASTVEEVKIAEEGHDFRKEPNTTEKDNNRHTRGRRIQEDGTLETSEHVLSDRFDNVPGFYHSVASGDPLSDSVIVWTRYTPNSKDEEIDLELRIEEATSTSNDTSPPRSVNFDNVNPTLLDPDLNSNLFRIKVTVTAANDFVAKIDLKGLKSNTWYVFAFSDGTQASDVGLTRTAPAENEVIESFQYAVFSCTHFTNGFFHSYDAASTIKDLDLWIHVGDYYYEYGLYSNYARDASEQRDPFLLPEWETIDLQDYRNRHASYVGFDEALRFLRRRAPMMATWDDHELTDNSWGNDSGAGAENHQATCPVGPNATKEEKVAAACDRDEGDAVERFSNALQAYLEWMPIRTAPGDMGALTGAGSITQVVEWGDLATIVSFDTRTSYRTEEPSGFRFGTFSEFAEQYPDYEKYTEEGSEEYIALNEFAQEQRAIQYREDAVMAAPYINNVLKPAFDASKQAGKPWQIWAANSLMGPYVLPPADQFFLDVPSLIQPVVKAAIDGLLSQNQSLALRAEIALAAVNMEWNADDYCGFAAERADVLKLAQDQDYNMIVLGGDLHDAFAWQMYEGGNRTGIPVAVNLACPGVTSPGLAQTFNPILASVGGALGGTDAFFNMLHGAYKRENPGLKLVDLRYAGFYVVTATKETHTAEYFGFPAETTLSNYADARASSEAITAEALCVGAVVTRASEPGSLDTVDGCTNTEFTKTRSKVFQMFVPNGTMTEGTTLSNCGAAGCTVSDTTVSVPPGSPSMPIGPPQPQPTPSPIYSAGVSLSPVFGFVTLATVAIFAVGV